MKLRFEKHIEDTLIAGDGVCNVDAVRKSLLSFTEPLVLIMGGRDKGGDFSSLRELVQQKVKTLIVLGEAAPTLLKVFNDCCPVRLVKNLDEAVKLSFTTSEPGDVVLLSPGCTSWDMFKDYQERGEMFKKLVNELKDPADE